MLLSSSIAAQSDHEPSPRIRLVALDLDGTLIGRDFLIRDAVREAVAAVLERGIPVTIATGRAFASTRRYAELLRLDAPLVCYQGAAIFETRTGRVLDETPLCAAISCEILTWANERGINPQCYHEDRVYVESLNKYSKEYAKNQGVELVVVPSLRETFAQCPTTKIILFDEPERALEHLAALQALTGERAYLTRSDPQFVEVLDPRVNKGRGVANVAKRLGIPMDEVLAVGDAWNDVPMFSAVGIGVAMGSAPPEVRSQADAVVADVTHDGVAEALHRFILSNPR
ncbi:MAG TPA: Cof-type HAD-IIB family hydrolase [Candidatus Baltobacteraceae bacterium]|jgi:hypothetical protein|nr:Cof-type HAD-IIB family hydrolase [Candidatus Baltobacteraceae bacterium]